MDRDLKQQFAEQGYVIIENLFSLEEVKELKAEVARVLEQVKQERGEGAVKHGVYVGMAAASGLFKQAAAKAELAKVLKKIVGDQVTFLSDKVVFKDSRVDFGSPWHQDYPYWEGSHKYSVWIALDDATPDNGCLKILPGSHLKGFLHHGGGDHDGNGFSSRLKDENIEQSQIIDLPASRGTAIVFHDLLFHSSYPNRSGKDRVALISTYKDGTQDDPDYEWAIAAFPI
ncbi:phytanoyl-CoA dioxygenase family protein [Paenibacillus nasutitermitis]|uniref:SnoK n=1 Tax=Paenibacillus nasutitermitis TaxID=1652958 RepID=A0A916YN84_9BACL|nr:phytanoyl-CoA dioxygenase family protein [Paenibacillus nasutitermitis]GGD53469.1 SnoK [Paenibacillus nasutitermitis]